MSRQFWIVRLVCLAVTNEFYQELCDEDNDDSFWDLSPVEIKRLTYNNENDADEVASALCGQFLGEAVTLYGGDKLVYGVSVTGIEVMPDYEVVQTSLVRSTGYIPTKAWDDIEQVKEGGEQSCSN